MWALITVKATTQSKNEGISRILFGPIRHDLLWMNIMIRVGGRSCLVEAHRASERDITSGSMMSLEYPVNGRIVFIKQYIKTKRRLEPDGLGRLFVFSDGENAIGKIC